MSRRDSQSAGKPATLGVRRPSLKLLSYLFVGAVALALTFVSSRKYLDRPYQVWAEVNAVWYQSTPLILPVVAAVAAALTLRFLGSGTMLSLAPAPRPLLIRILRLVGGVFGGALLGATIGLSPLLWAAQRTATYGNLDFRDWIFFASAVWFSTAAGAALAILLRSIAAIPVVLVLTLIWTQAANYFGDRFWSIAPFRGFEPDAGQGTGAVVGILGPVVLLIASGALVSLSWAWSRIPPSIPVRVGGTILPVALLLACLGLPAALRPPLWDVGDASARSCVDSRDYSLCVHSAHRGDLPEAMRSLDALMANYGTRPTPPLVIIDRSLLMRPVPLAPGTVVVRVPVGEAAAISRSVADGLAGFFACGGDRTPEQREFSVRFEEWLLTGDQRMIPGSEQGVGPDKIREYTARNAERIAHCLADAQEVSQI